MVEKDRDITTIRTEEFTETPRLVLEQPVGDISIQGWDNTAIEISTGDDDDDYDVEVTGSQVTLRNRRRKVHIGEGFEGPWRELGNLGVDVERVARRVEKQVERGMRRFKGINIDLDLGRWSHSHDFTIKVPHNCDLMLRTSTGDMYVKDVNGTLFIQTTSGDLNLDSLSGNLLVSTASGDIHVRGMEGKVGARSASGDITLERGDLQELGVQTASGDINVYLKRVPEREFDVRTVSGDLRVTLPNDARLTAEMTTVSGDLRCKLPHEIISRSGRRTRTLVVNGGGPAARFHSVSGDVSVMPDRFEGGARTSDLSRAEGESDGSEEDIRVPEGEVSREQAQLDILQAVQRGEITSQEALRRLSSMGR
ncbi:MAG TPA: DUF4097 family beta strand repeat-containing protein [Chloroflexia bacterium]|nr:DUF4097 family beta strand repeat-containing protein [Chloroflexia bacterium]